MLSTPDIRALDEGLDGSVAAHLVNGDAQGLHLLQALPHAHGVTCARMQVQHQVAADGVGRDASRQHALEEHDGPIGVAGPAMVAQDHVVADHVRLDARARHALQPLLGALDVALLGKLVDDGAVAVDCRLDAFAGHDIDPVGGAHDVASLRARVDHRVVANRIRFRRTLTQRHGFQPMLSASRITRLSAGMKHGAEAHDVGGDAVLTHASQPALGPIDVADASTGIEHCIVAHDILLDTQLWHLLKPLFSLFNVPVLGTSADQHVHADSIRAAQAGLLKGLEPPLRLRDVARLGMGADEHAVGHDAWPAAGLHHLLHGRLSKDEVASLRCCLQLGSQSELVRWQCRRGHVSVTVPIRGG
mmetsp:Transcript_12576/g.32544  ORF Transcript_12576/g.32544 Transcript_12576/m.32544 type:complete len:360 (+) Transcript_12576:1513-2592(+)